MQRNRILGVALVVFCWVAGGRALADPPTTWSVSYAIHEIPDDPDSTVAFYVTLALSRRATDGNWLGWHVIRVEIRQVSSERIPDPLWTDPDPVLDTPGGLWWTQHEDIEDPQLAEFALPPALSGIATAEYAIDDDLEYSLEGLLYEPPPPPELPPYEVTGAMSYEFRLLGDPEPLISGPDDEVEIGPGGQGG